MHNITPESAIAYTHSNPSEPGRNDTLEYPNIYQTNYSRPAHTRQANKYIKNQITRTLAPTSHIRPNRNALRHITCCLAACYARTRRLRSKRTCEPIVNHGPGNQPSKESTHAERITCLAQLLSGMLRQWAH
jgi:hypothetical protein